MPFNPNIPLGTDLLSTSQQDLLTNNGFLNSVFLVDHYTFSDATVDAGKHNTVTTPNVHTPAGHPSTVIDPKMYGMQDSANVGIIQYSRGPNDAVPSPITYLQSPSAPINLAPNAFTNVLDMTGLPVCMGIVFGSGYTGANVALGIVLAAVSWTGVAPMVINTLTSGSTSLIVNQIGNIVRIQNTFGGNQNIRWTMQLWRLQ